MCCQTTNLNRSTTTECSGMPGNLGLSLPDTSDNSGNCYPGIVILLCHLLLNFFLAAVTLMNLVTAFLIARSTCSMRHTASADRLLLWTEGSLNYLGKPESLGRISLFSSNIPGCFSWAACASSRNREVLGKSVQSLRKVLEKGDLGYMGAPLLQVFQSLLLSFPFLQNKDLFFSDLCIWQTLYVGITTWDVSGYLIARLFFWLMSQCLISVFCTCTKGQICCIGNVTVFYPTNPCILNRLNVKW